MLLEITTVTSSTCVRHTHLNKKPVPPQPQPRPQDNLISDLHHSNPQPVLSAEKHQFFVFRYPFPSQQPHPDPHPIVPFPFSSLHRYLPESNERQMDAQTDGP